VGSSPTGGIFHFSHFLFASDFFIHYTHMHGYKKDYKKVWQGIRYNRDISSLVGYIFCTNGSFVAF